MKVRDEINKFSREEDKPILLWLLDRYHMASQWQFVAECKFTKYGPASYQARRVWMPSDEGIILYKHMREEK